MGLDGVSILVRELCFPSLYFHNTTVPGLEVIGCGGKKIAKQANK